jgi:hypothetical protein
LSGAEAPNVFMPMTRPESPTYRSQPNIAGLFSQLNEKLECFVGDAVLGVIEIQAHGLDRHALTAFGIVGKQLPQVQLRGAFVV